MVIFVHIWLCLNAVVWRGQLIGEMLMCDSTTSVAQSRTALVHDRLGGEDPPSHGDGGFDKLLEQLRLWHGGLRAEPGHFTGWSLGARFYPVLYLLTRMGEARDWGTGLPLKANLLGKMSRLEVHHIFPKAQLYKAKFKKPEVNAVANFCFLTKDTNLNISDELPERYFPAVEVAHPGALAFQWIPLDESLWRIDRFREFLEARKVLLAAELNRRMEELIHGELHWMRGAAAIVAPQVVGGLSCEQEEQDLLALQLWVETQGFATGVLSFDYSDPQSGEQREVFDLAWPAGLQEELSQPVAVLLNEDVEVLSIASQAGYRTFTSTDDFRCYVLTELQGAAGWAIGSARTLERLRGYMPRCLEPLCATRALGVGIERPLDDGVLNVCERDGTHAGRRRQPRLQ